MFKLHFRKSDSGFTLIELLVVVAIIGVLSSVVLSSLNSARNKGRDTSNIQSMIEIRKALEFYRSNNDSYPHLGVGNICGRVYFDPSGTRVNYYPYSSTELVPGLVPSYIASYPFNLSTKLTRAYIYCSNGVDYFFEGYRILENPLPAASHFSVPVMPTVVFNTILEPRSMVVYSNINYLQTSVFLFP